MSKADFVVSPELSYKLAPGHLGSADTLIRSRKQVEVKPQSSETIELYPSPTSRTEFVLNAHSGWMDNAKSHFECDVSVYSLDNATPDVSRALCTGGLHSFIRTVTVVDGSGTEISCTPEYAKLYGMMSNYNQSPAHVEASGMFSGDSVQPYVKACTAYSDFDILDEFSAITTDPLLAAYNHTTGVISAVTVDLTGPNAPRSGDKVILQHVNGCEDGTISAVTATTITITSGLNGGANLVAGEITAVLIRRVPTNQRFQTNRAYVANYNTAAINNPATPPSATLKLQIKLANPFLQMEEYVPLLFIPNMRIIIEWNPAWMCIMNGRWCAATPKTHAVRVQNPRYIMSIVEPVEQVIADWHARYMSDQGLIYHIVDYYNNRKYFQTGGSADSWVVPCTFVSARAAIAALYPKHCFVQDDDQIQTVTTGDSDSFSIDKTGIFYNANVHEYEFVVGSDRYPLNGRVKCDKLGGQNLLHNLKTLGVADSKDLKLRFDPLELRAIHPTQVDERYGFYAGGTNYNNSAESLKTIFTADLTKEGELSGVSLRNQDLMPNFYRSTSSPWGVASYNTELYCLVYVPHDRVIRISKADGGVRVFD